MKNKGGFGGGGAGRGCGMGRGTGAGGRGKRQGMGQGCATGRGMGRGRLPSDSTSSPKSREVSQGAEAFNVLKHEMMAQLRSVNKRIAGFDEETNVPPVSSGDSKYESNKEKNSEKTTAFVDEKRCIRCEFCVDICPENAITMNGPAVIDPNKCTACGSCILECPHDAISFSNTAKA